MTTGILALGTVLMVLATQRAVWYGLKQGFAAPRCVIVSTVTFLGLLIFTLVMTSLVLQQNVLALWRQGFETSLRASVDFYQELGWEVDEIERAAALIRRFFLDAIVGWVAVMAAAFSTFSYFLQRRLAPDLPGSQMPLTPFSRWTAWEKMIWVLLAALVFLGLGARGLSGPGWLGLNALIVMGSIYLVVGLSVIIFYFNQKNIPPALKIGAVLIMGLVPALLIFVVLLGIFDTWWDWRRLKKTPDHPAA